MEILHKQARGRLITDIKKTIQKTQASIEKNNLRKKGNKDNFKQETDEISHEKTWTWLKKPKK